MLLLYSSVRFSPNISYHRGHGSKTTAKTCTRVFEYSRVERIKQRQGQPRHAWQENCIQTHEPRLHIDAGLEICSEQQPSKWQWHLLSFADGKFNRRNTPKGMENGRTRRSCAKGPCKRHLGKWDCSLREEYWSAGECDRFASKWPSGTHAISAETRNEMRTKRSSATKCLRLQRRPRKIRFKCGCWWIERVRNNRRLLTSTEMFWMVWFSVRPRKTQSTSTRPRHQTEGDVF